MDYTIDDITAQHPEYKANLEHWQFLNNSYLGGNYYKSQSYLTRYVYETEGEYAQRMRNTPLDNHCSPIVGIYNSFLFKEAPTRNFGTLEGSPFLEDFLEDADYDDRSFDDFMAEVDRISAVYGNCWVIVDKPGVEATTAAEEQEMGIRPYVSMFAPTAIVDWSYSRLPTGAYVLDYLKILETDEGNKQVYKIFTPDYIDTVVVYNDVPATSESIPNPLGFIPAVCVYDVRSPVKGVGVSAITGVADMQRAIFDKHSELEQLIRLANHPSLVKTEGTRASAGAGSVITIDDNMPGDVKPYLLQPNAGSIDGIRNTISDMVEAINRMAFVGAIRAKEAKVMSGVAMDTEFKNLAARLGNKADQLQLAEEVIWQIFCIWLGREWDGKVEYVKSYNTRDKITDLNILKQAIELLPNNQALRDEMARQVAEMVSEDSDIIEEIATGDNSLTTEMPEETEQEDV